MSYPEDAPDDELLAHEARLVAEIHDRELALDIVQAELQARALGLDHPAHEYGTAGLAAMRRRELREREGG